MTKMSMAFKKILTLFTTMVSETPRWLVLWWLKADDAIDVDPLSELSRVPRSL